jgi:hypothetical protein
MTSVLDSADGELIHAAALRLWRESQRIEEALAVPSSDSGGWGDWGDHAHSITDQEVAHETALPIGVVRAWLHEFDGTRLAIGYYGDTVTVKAPLGA